MTNFELISNHYRFDTKKNIFIKQTVSTIFEGESIKHQEISEEKTIVLPKTDKDLFKLILADTSFNLENVKAKRTNVIEALVYDKLSIYVSKRNDSTTLEFNFSNDIKLIHTQDDFNELLNSYYLPNKIKPKKTISKSKSSLLMFSLIFFAIYISLGLISFLVYNQNSAILKIAYIITLLVFESLLLYESINRENITSSAFLIVNGVLLLIGITLVILYGDTSNLIYASGYLLIYPAIITLILGIIYGFAQDFINKVFSIIQEELHKRKLIKGKRNQVNLYFPKSFKRIVLRILSIMLKATFIATLVLFIIDLEEKSLPRDVFIILLLAIPISLVLAYWARFTMYGICQVCGNNLVFSSIEEKIIPAYETSETKYKDHAVKDDTGRILGYVTSETEIITEHPEQTQFILHHCCSNEKCNLYGYELNKSFNAILWILFGIW